MELADTQLSDLVRRWGFCMIPWREMRKCPCPKCSKKSLGYADHPHAFGWKDHDKIQCRSCRAGFKSAKK